jgi:DNA repair exonuclease SbcCD ATPase subunit
MKLIISICLSLFASFTYSQNYEILVEKRLMSLGENSANKIILPNQQVSRIEKITARFLKSNSAESIKPPKNSKEFIYKSVFLKDVTTPNFLYYIIEQQGPNVGWTGFFFNEKDTSELTNGEAINAFLSAIYKLSMFSLYEDSIDIQSSILKDAENRLKDLEKSATKNDKNINKSKKDIADSEKEIEKSNTKIKQTTEQLKDLNNSVKEAEAKLKEAQAEMGKVDQLEKTLDDLEKRAKEMSKRLKDLSKDPTGNGNMILAQNQDIAQNAEMIKNQQIELLAAEKAAKNNLKNAEKSLGKAKDNLKDAEKTIKAENKNIDKSKDDIADKKNEIENSSEEIKKIENKEKLGAIEIIEKEKAKLDLLKKAQSQYK